MIAARHLRPNAPEVANALRRRGRQVWPLQRRGADLGYAVPVARHLPSPAEATAIWRRSEPVYLPGVLGNRPQRFAVAIAATLRTFARWRRGGSLLEAMERRLASDPDLQYAGSDRDAKDPREVERIYFHAEPAEAPGARDLWAKLAWIANDEADPSLRLRFSAGLEDLDVWMQSSDLTASWVDRLAARAFPECGAILGCAPLRRMLQHLLARPHRLSERIVYNNAPGGGAVFHHDAEPGQLGVVYSQLEGHTAWLSISKRRLAALLVRTGQARSELAAMAALDAGEAARLRHLLNRDAGFTAELAARGALFVLEAGDSIVLPSQGIDDVAWHSVVALGTRPSLAHSYGIFVRQPDYPMAADPGAD